MNDLRKKWIDKFNIVDSPYTHEFRPFNQIDLSKGDTYTDLEMCYTNLLQHDSLDDIINTINHEALHASLADQNLQDEYEHLLIRRIFWFIEGLY